MNTVNQTKDKDNDRMAVMYLRVASSDLADQEHGLAAQREACEHEADRLGAAITSEFTDIGASGNDKSRGGLRRLLVAVRKRSVRYVIVRDRTRLARNAADHRAIQQQVQRAGATVVTVDDGAHSQVTVDELLGGIR